MNNIVPFPQDEEAPENSKMSRVLLNLETMLNTAIEYQSPACMLPQRLTKAMDDLLGLISLLKQGVDLDVE